MQPKYLYIIAGPNGAGKTTASLTLLPEFLEIDTFVNADMVAKELSPDNVDAVSFEAGRIMLERINELLFKGRSLAFETTLAARSYKSLIQKARSKGYFVTLLCFSHAGNGCDEGSTAGACRRTQHTRRNNPAAL